MAVKMRLTRLGDKKSPFYRIVVVDSRKARDGERTKAVYRFRTDLLLEHNLAGRVKEQAQMERELKAIIQQYMTRMTTNALVAGGGK